MDHPANSSPLEIGRSCTAHTRPVPGFSVDGCSHVRPRKRFYCADCAVNRDFLDCTVVCNGSRSSPHPKPLRGGPLRVNRARLGVCCLVCYDLTHENPLASFPGDRYCGGFSASAAKASGPQWRVARTLHTRSSPHASRRWDHSLFCLWSRAIPESRSGGQSGRPLSPCWSRSRVSKSGTFSVRAERQCHRRSV